MFVCDAILIRIRISNFLIRVPSSIANAVSGSFVGPDAAGRYCGCCVASGHFVYVDMIAPDGHSAYVHMYVRVHPKPVASVKSILAKT